MINVLRQATGHSIQEAEMDAASNAIALKEAKGMLLTLLDYLTKID